MAKNVAKQDFNVLGKIFTVSEQRARYNMYRAVYSKMADELSEKYIKVYLKGIKDIDKIHEEGHQKGLLCIFEAIKKSVDILVNNKIYDIDEEVFFNQYFSRYYTWDEAFDRVDDRYLRIVCSAEELREYREARKESRGRVVGGGFGVGGAIKGSLQAGAMNLATGAAYGLLNYFENKATEKRVRQEKQALSEDPTVYSTLERGIYENVFNVQYALYDIIGHLDGAEWDIVGDNEEEKVKILLGNLSRVRDAEGRSDILLQCLQLDPYNPQVYEKIFADSSLSIGEVGKVCEFFHIEIKEILEPYFSNEFSKCEKTESGINAYIKKINEKMKAYGITDTSFVDDAYKKMAGMFAKQYKQETSQIGDARKLRTYQEEMIKKIESYEKQCNNFADKLKRNIEKDLRTYDGVEYATMEERLRVEKNDEEVKERVKGFREMSDDQITALYKELEAGNYSDSCKRNCKKEIEKYYDSKLRNEKINFDSLNREELLALKTKIQEGKYSTKTKKEFVEKIDGCIQKIDAALNKKALEQLLSTIRNDDLSAINGAFNQIMNKENRDENDKSAIIRLLEMQLEIGSRLYETELNGFYKGGSEAACLVEGCSIYMKSRNPETVLKISDWCDKVSFELEDDESFLVLFEEKRLISLLPVPFYAEACLISNKKIYISLSDGKYACHVLDEPSIEQMDREYNKGNRTELWNKEHAIGMKELRAFVAGVQEKTKLQQVFCKLPTDGEALKFLSKKELEKEYSKWEEYAKCGTKVTNYLSLVETAIKEVYKKEADELCVGLSDKSVSELKTIKFKFQKQFSFKNFSECITKQENAVVAELTRREDMATREEIAEKKSKLDSLTKEELEREYKTWDVYTGNVSEAKEFLKAVKDVLGKIYKEEVEKECANLEKLTVKGVKDLLNRINRDYIDKDCIREEIALVEAAIAAKQEEEIRSWMPENFDLLSMEELEKYIIKCNSGNYEPAMYVKYALPMIEKRNLRLIDTAGDLIDFIESKAAVSVKSCMKLETKGKIAYDIKQQTEADADTLVCSIGNGNDVCKLFVKKFVNGKKSMPWEKLLVFEAKKKLFGGTLSYRCKDGASGEVSIQISASLLASVADLLNEIILYMARMGNTSQENVLAPRTEAVVEVVKAPIALDENAMKEVAEKVAEVQEKKMDILQPAESEIELPQIPTPVPESACSMTTTNHSFSEMADYVNKFPALVRGSFSGTWNPKFGKKVKNAVKAYAVMVREDDVFALYDDTLLGSGKEGFVMTCKEMVIKTSLNATFRCTYADITGLKIIYKTDAKLTGLSVETKFGNAQITGWLGEEGSRDLANRINEIVKYLFGLDQVPYTIEKQTI